MALCSAPTRALAAATAHQKQNQRNQYCRCQVESSLVRGSWFTLALKSALTSPRDTILRKTTEDVCSHRDRCKSYLLSSEMRYLTGQLCGHGTKVTVWACVLPFHLDRNANGPRGMGGYEVSQKKRKQVEQSFGWMKMVGTLKKWNLPTG